MDITLGARFMSKDEGWVGYLRLVTPLISFIVMFLIMTIKGDISRIENSVKDLDTKMFKHITNDEMHSPRSLVVLKPEFQMYYNMINGQLNSINNEICEIKNYILTGEIKMNRRS